MKPKKTLVKAYQLLLQVFFLFFFVHQLQYLMYPFDLVFLSVTLKISRFLSGLRLYILNVESREPRGFCK